MQNIDMGDAGSAGAIGGKILTHLLIAIVVSILFSVLGAALKGHAWWPVVAEIGKDTAKEAGQVIAQTVKVIDRPRAAASFGSVAYDEFTGRYGLSWNQKTASRADDAALTGCAAENCRIVFRVGPQQCGALAASDSGSWGGSTRPQRDAARLAAIENCQERTSAQCKVRRSLCNS